MFKSGGLGWVLAFVVTLGAMLWPAAINGRPAYFFDSPGYYANGRSAVTLALSKLSPVAPHAELAGAAAKGHPTAKPPDAVVAIRAVAYAIFAYLGGAPRGQMVVAIVTQAGLLSIMLLIWWRRIAPDAGWRDAAVAAVAVGVGTTAPWFASFAMPDIFAGISILGYLILAWPASRPLGALATAFIFSVIGFAFAAHASHVPLILGLSLFAIGQVVWGAARRRDLARLRAIPRLAAPVVIGVAAVLATSMVGFSQVSLAPKRLPLVLARSIADGPARWYLNDHCASEHYVICDLFPVMPTRLEDVLFGPNGLRVRATPAQMEAIRREEPIIVARAIRAYPLHQAEKAARAFGRQLLRFDLHDTRFTRRALQTSQGDVYLIHAREQAGVRMLFNLGVYIALSGAIIYLAVIARRFRAGEGGLLLLALAGLLGNAAVTGILSGVAHRYQGRIIWVIPVLAIGFFLARRRPSGMGEPQFTGALPTPAGTLKALD